jgi:tryptophanyl-tRNA synthetase
VPVGEDQIPMIEQTNEIVRKFNRMYNCEILVEAKALVPEIGRLPGIDGKAKMSKSLGNTINLGATPDEIRAAVKQVYTDPLHLRVQDPGHLEGNVAFIYLDAFDTEKAALEEMKAHYVRGGLGDSIVKKRLEVVLQEMLAPIRARREEFAKDKGQVMQILKEGTAKAREVAARTADEVKAALGLSYF